MTHRTNPPAGFSAATRQSPQSLHRLNSTELFSRGREVIIEHAGDEYRLRLTSQGKLILTK